MSFPVCRVAFPRLPASHHPLFMLACRIVELFPAVPINPHWGIVSKCLAYSKAACDPFVYSLLRHQYKKTCTDIINRLLKRSSLNTSGRGHESQGNSIPTAEWQERGMMGWDGGARGWPLETVREIWSWFIVNEKEDKYWLFLSTSAWIWSDMPKKRKKKRRERVTTDKGKSLHRNTTVLAYWVPRTADQCSELAARTLNNGRFHIHLERQMCSPKKNGQFTASLFQTRVAFSLTGDILSLQYMFVLTLL